MGPTASGKTDLALALYGKLPVDIISVDSALVYRDMDIGSAKPDKSILARVPHQLIDIRDPEESYSAADFFRDVVPLLEQSHSRGRIPLLVGGTMLYFRVLLDGLGDLPPSDPAVRDSILNEAEQRGWPALHQELNKVDPVTAAQLHPNHSQRIQRALEIFRLTGVPASQLKASVAEGFEPITDRFDIQQLGLVVKNRAILHQRIANRFEAMVAQGFIDEVRSLMARPGLNPDLPAMRAVGYRQVWGYLAGEYDYQTMVAKGIAATRQLAKRQLTWLRGWPDLKPIAIDDDRGKPRDFEQILANCLKFLENIPIY
jgi:tRNA dimethylallyltransferase